MSGTPDTLIVESIVRDVLEGEAGRATLKVASSSMSPRILEGDSISIVRVAPRELLPGDVIVFRSEAAGLVVHRLLWRNHPLGQPSHVFTKGDAVDCLDRSVPVDRVLGRVESIVRGEGRLRPTTSLDRLRCLIKAAGYGTRRWFRRRLGGMQRAIRPGKPDNLENR
jgi:signal peptidase I